MIILRFSDTIFNDSQCAFSHEKGALIVQVVIDCMNNIGGWAPRINNMQSTIKQQALTYRFTSHPYLLQVTMQVPKQSSVVTPIAVTQQQYQPAPPPFAMQ